MDGLVLEGISKYYPASDTQANDGVSLRVVRGGIHALVGENGAGKTTLMRILYGLERPDSGRILLDGREVRIHRPSDASGLGIGMVHQHFMTVGGFTVGENVVLGNEPRRAGLFFDAAAADRGVRATMERYGFRLDPRRMVDGLTVGERQQLEIVRLLHRNADILVLDEPTAVLTEQEIASLFTTLRTLAAAGRTIIIITHKVREVKEISDTVTVMRAGRTVQEFRTADVDEYTLSCLIMGTSSCGDFSRTRSPALRDEAAFEMDDVTLRVRHRGAPLLDRVRLRVRPGEILGLCGVSGNGMGELEDLLGGFASPDSGRILLHGKPLPPRRLPARSGRGLGYVPADRMRRGASPGMTVRANYIALDRRHYHPCGLADPRAIDRATARAIEAFSVKGRPGQPLRELSGGNVQKLILARELADPHPDFLVFSDPTWGLDIASTESVYGRIVAARDAGVAILLVSSNLDEVLALSDRISVLYRGRIVCDLDNDGTVGRERLGEYMLGLADDSGGRYRDDGSGTHG